MNDNRVSKTAFKAKALEFFRRIEASGESVIVTDHGKPMLEIRPYRSLKHDPLRFLRGSLLRYDNPTEPVAENDWEADA